MTRAGPGFAPAIAALALGGTAAGAVHQIEQHLRRRDRPSKSSSATMPATICRHLGVKVGGIDEIEPEPQRAKLQDLLHDNARSAPDENALIDEVDHLARRSATTPPIPGGPTWPTERI